MTDSKLPNYSQHQRVVEMLRVIRQDILDRLQRGELNYKRDSQTLMRQLDLLEELGNPKLSGQLLDVLGMVENEVGQHKRALQLWESACNQYENVLDLAGMARVQNHIGEVHFRLGRYTTAQQAYEEARTLAEAAKDKTYIMRVESNLGLLWLYLGDMLQARICFALVISITEYETWQHVHSLAAAHRGMAEVQLSEGNLASAWESARLAEHFAQGAELKLLLAQAYLTMSHIAEQDPDHQGLSADYLQQAYDLLNAYNNRISLARTLLQEARYQASKGYPDNARKLATQAKALFETLRLQDEIGLVTEFLLILPDNSE